jgi:hypothetical protein
MAFFYSDSGNDNCMLSLALGAAKYSIYLMDIAAVRAWPVHQICWRYMESRTLKFTRFYGVKPNKIEKKPFFDCKFMSKKNRP